MLGIVVVTYKSFDDTVAFVKQVLPKVGIPYRAVIVDLGNDVDTAAAWQRLAALRWSRRTTRAAG